MPPLPHWPEALSTLMEEEEEKEEDEEEVEAAPLRCMAGPIKPPMEDEEEE